MYLSALRGVWNYGSFLYNLNSELEVYPQFPSVTSGNLFFCNLKERRQTGQAVVQPKMYLQYQVPSFIACFHWKVTSDKHTNVIKF